MGDKITVALEPNKLHALAMLEELAEEDKLAPRLFLYKTAQQSLFFVL